METTNQAPLDASASNLRVLIVEDSQIEAKLIANLLKKNGYPVHHQRVETEDEMVAALEQYRWDIVVSDYQMPDFDGARALKVYQRYNLDIPFILVSGKIGEEAAVELMKMGAHDYIMKGNTARLIPAIESHLQEAANRRENRRLEQRLKESEAQYRGFFENANIGIFRCTEQGSLLDANKCLASAFGYEDGHDFIKCVERLAPEIHDPVTRKARSAQLLELANYEKSRDVIFHRQDGSIMEAAINVWTIQEHPDRPVYLEGIIEDVSKHKAMERKLREIEELHESLIDITSNL